MGGTKCKTCNDIAKDIWLLCIKHNVWISSAYILGTHSVIADQKSRKCNDDKEWQLDTLIYCKVVDNFSLNQRHYLVPCLLRLDKYVSWKPDSESGY